jgi:hypothetical protein
MKAIALTRESLAVAPPRPLVLAQDVVDDAGKPEFRKGHVLGAADFDRLVALPWSSLHAIALEPDEIHEDEAGQRLAAAIAGTGVALKALAAGAWPIAAAHRGIVRVDVDILRAVNGIDGICAYTAFDGQVVNEGDVVARAKIIPFVLPQSHVTDAEQLAMGRAVVSVRPFRPLAVAAVVQERLDENARARFDAVLREKLGWFGATLVGSEFVSADVAAVAAAVQRMVAAGAAILVMAGTKAMDPLDPAFQALERLGAPLERYGVPAHPGSLFWLARLGEVPVLGMPTCGLFSQATTFDLILPRVLTGEPVDRTTLADLGHGGLLSRDAAFRFPPYRPSTRRGELE